MADSNVEVGRLKQELQIITEKLSDLEAEIDEYNIVIEALKPLNGTRKCHRLVNGILVERTVAQVLPALSINLEKAQKLQAGLVDAYKVKEEEVRTELKSGSA